MPSSGACAREEAAAAARRRRSRTVVRRDGAIAIAIAGDVRRAEEGETQMRSGLVGLVINILPMVPAIHR